MSFLCSGNSVSPNYRAHYRKCLIKFDLKNHSLQSGGFARQRRLFNQLYTPPSFKVRSSMTQWHWRIKREQPMVTMCNRTHMAPCGTWPKLSLLSYIHSEHGIIKSDLRSSLTKIRSGIKVTLNQTTGLGAAFAPQVQTDIRHAHVMHEQAKKGSSASAPISSLKSEMLSERNDWFYGYMFQILF